MSPVFGSVTAARPSSRPVRRDVLSTSGVARRIASMRPHHAVRSPAASCPAASRSRARTRLRRTPAAGRCRAPGSTRTTRRSARRTTRRAPADAAARGASIARRTEDAAEGPPSSTHPRPPSAAAARRARVGVEARWQRCAASCRTAAGHATPARAGSDACSGCSSRPARARATSAATRSSRSPAR